MNHDVDELGYNRCHGSASLTRTSYGDIARVTDPLRCIYQRIGIWKGTKKGERQFSGRIGCCIRDYVNEPLTANALINLRDEVEYELKQVFPELPVVVSRVRSDGRNEVTIETTIGNFEIDVQSNSAELETMHDNVSRMLKGLNIAMQDLKLGNYR